MNSFEEALCRLDRHIWSMAQRFGKSIRGQDVQDLHQEGIIKLYEIYSSNAYTGKPTEELDTIFKKSLWNLLRDMYRRDRRISKVVLLQLDNDSTGLETEQYSYDAFVELYLGHYTEALSHTLSRDAVALLELLLSPTPAVYHIYNIVVMRRKALLLQGHNVYIPTKPTQEVFGKALGFGLSKTKKLMSELRNAWKQECQSVRTSFKPNEAKS